MRVVIARDLATALAALGSSGPNARILAGGTDLVVEMESGRTRPDLVVDVGRVTALRYVRETDSGLELGAGTTCTDLLRSPVAHRHADVLIEAAREVGAVQIQNRATIGGNLATASPAADLVPVLFALGARVRLTSRRGSREIAVEHFVSGYRTTVREHDEIVEAVMIPRRPRAECRAFRKVGTRRAQSISKLVIALAVGPRGEDARIAVGSVAERTVRLPALEAALARDPSRSGIEAAVARSIQDEIRPREDVRSTVEYRRTVLGRLLVRMLREALVTGDLTP